MSLCACGRPRPSRAKRCAACRPKVRGLYRRRCPICQEIKPMKKAGTYCSVPCASKARCAKRPDLLAKAAKLALEARKARMLAKVAGMTPIEAFQHGRRSGYMARVRYEQRAA